MKSIIIMTILVSSALFSAEKPDHPFCICLIDRNSPKYDDIEVPSYMPIITDKDIVEYDWKTHSIMLTNEAFNRINSQKEYLLYHRRFIVVAKGVKCYEGYFWASYYSLACSFPIINIAPYQPRKKNEIIIERSYPSLEFAEGEDPRNDSGIYDVLYKLGKIKNQ